MPDYVASSSTISCLQELASGLRIQFEHVLQASLGHRETRDTCALASLLVAEAIDRFTAWKATIRGGAGLTEGIRDKAGLWRGHYWVEVATEDGDVIVDIAADQFGWPTTVVAAAAHMKGVYLAGEQALADAHMRMVQQWLAANEEMVKELLPGRSG